MYKSKGGSVTFSPEDTTKHNYKFKGTRSVGNIPKSTRSLPLPFLFLLFFNSKKLHRNIDFSLFLVLAETDAVTGRVL